MSPFERAGLYYVPDPKKRTKKLGPVVWYGDYGRRFEDNHVSWKFRSISGGFLERIIGPQALTQWNDET
jgi:hypothetical protein